MFQYRKRYGLHAILKAITNHNRIKRFNTASGMDCMQYRHYVVFAELRRFQYRKRYGLHAIQKGMSFVEKKKLFQYRKRYGLHAMRGWDVNDLDLMVSIPQAVWIACNLVALGRCAPRRSVSIPQAVWIACNHRANHRCTTCTRFNTASGMDCMQ